MITIIGTHHRHFEQNELSIADRVRLDHFDRIFTEGFSRDGLSVLDTELEKIVQQNENLQLNQISGITRGPEPQSLEAVTDAEITYLDDELSTEVLQQICRTSLENHEEAKVTPYEDLEEHLLKGQASRENYIEFFEDLRDGSKYIAQSYAALSEKGYEMLIEDTAEEFSHELAFAGVSPPDTSQEFLDGIEKHGITFQDYIQTYAEDRKEFQDQRDEEWYQQITEQLGEEENALVVAGIHHALNYEGTVRRKLQEEYKEISANPFRHF